MPLHWDGVVAANHSWVACAYAPTIGAKGRIVAISLNNGTNVMTSDDGGKTWTDQGLKWVANMGGDGYSLSNGRQNGIVWEPITQQFLGVQTVTKTGVVALALYKSADGVTWTRSIIDNITTVGGINLIIPIATNGAGTVVIPMNGSLIGTRVYTSPDSGVTWSHVSVPADLTPQVITYANGLWVCSGQSAGEPIIYASDPTQVAPAGGGWAGSMGFTVGFINKNWIALAFDAHSNGWALLTWGVDGLGAIARSGDAVNWTLGTMPSVGVGISGANGWGGIIYQAAVGLIAVLSVTGSNASEESAISTDGGATWTRLTTPDQSPPDDDGANWTCLVYDSGHGKYVGFSKSRPTYNVMTQLDPVPHFYHNPDTGHYLCATVNPGSPWVLGDPTLTVTGIAPNIGPDTGGQPVTITGTGFSDGATVTIGGVALVSAVVVNSTTITGVTPAGADGLAAVAVTNPADCSGTTASANLYRYAPWFTDDNLPSGGIVMGGDTDTGIGASEREPVIGGTVECADLSTIVANMALSRLGVSRQLSDITMDTTVEAVMARLHYNADVDVVLAAFPWEFARKYNGLVLVTGTFSDPVNGDWTFAYRSPSDCVFERRIVVARGFAVNPTPPPFALSSDSDGGLILTNEANAVLEYTFRPVCAASSNDPIFLEALAWKLAASIAPALTRIAGKSDECLKEFEKSIARAYDVQRPGNPGLPPAAPTIDTSDAATAANLAVVNRALVRIGARTIGSLDDQSREATSARLVFEEELQATLRDFPWAFATRYAEMAAVAGPVDWEDALVQAWDALRTYQVNDVVSLSSITYYCILDNTNQSPPNATYWSGTAPQEANGDWLHAYRTPGTMLSARRLVKELTRRVYDDNPFTFKVGTDDGGELLYTDAEQAVLEYTSRIDRAVLLGDALFKDAFAWRLASSLAPSLAQVDPSEVEQLGRGTDATASAGKQPVAKANQAQQRQNAARYALSMYLSVLERAKDANANENQDEKLGDAPWVEDRGMGRLNQRARQPWDR